MFNFLQEACFSIESMQDARARAYRAVDAIEFEGKILRRDIGKDAVGAA